MVQKLRANLKSIEEEICDKRKKFEELTKTSNCLNEVNKSLEADLRCTKEKLHDVQLNVKCTKEKWRLDRDTLCDQLKIKCKQIDNLEIRNNEINCKIEKSTNTNKTLVKTLTELKEASLRKYNEIKKVVQKLKEENCTKEAELSRLKHNSQQLKRDNEFIVMEMKAQQKYLKKCALLSNEIDNIKQKVECSYDSEKPSINMCDTKNDSENTCVA